LNFQFNLRESISLKLIPNNFDRFKDFNIVIKGQNYCINYNAEQINFNKANADIDENNNKLSYYNDIDPNFNVKRKNIFIDTSFLAGKDILNSQEDTNYLNSAEDFGNDIIYNTIFKSPNDIFEDTIYIFNDNNDNELSYRTFITQILNAISFLILQI
jgi:hypothetical protein